MAEDNQAAERAEAQPSEGTGDVPRRLRRFYRQQKKEEEAGAGAAAEAGQASVFVPAEEKMPRAATGALQRDEQKRARFEELKTHELKKFQERFKRMPRQDELSIIAENVFEQLQKEGPVQQAREQKEQLKEHAERTEGRRQAREERMKRPVEEAEEPEGQKPAPAEAGSVAVQDLFGDEFAAEKKKKGIEDELSLEGMEKDSGKGLEELAGIGESGDMPGLKEFGAEKNACPSCGKPTPNIVFCPGCGNAFCENCAKSKTVDSGFLRLICPKCGKETKTRL